MPIIRATCEYKKVNNCSIKADIYLPNKVHPPVVLYIHGGALISGTRRYIPKELVRMLNKEGYAVISIDYRLAPETKLEFIINDISDALHWIKDEGARICGFDSDKIAVMGSSAGGYLSLMTGTFASKPNAIVTFYGYGDILGDWYLKPSEFYCNQEMISKEDAFKNIGSKEKSTGGNDRYLFYYYTRQLGIWTNLVSGYDVNTQKEKLLKYCPIHNVTGHYPPTLMIHGDKDTDVPYEQSVQMFKKLQDSKVVSEMITYYGGDHGFDYSDRNKPEMKEVRKKIVEFLKANI